LPFFLKKFNSPSSICTSSDWHTFLKVPQKALVPSSNICYPGTIYLLSAFLDICSFMPTVLLSYSVHITNSVILNIDTVFKIYLWPLLLLYICIKPKKSIIEYNFWDKSKHMTYRFLIWIFETIFIFNTSKAWLKTHPKQHIFVIWREYLLIQLSVTALFVCIYLLSFLLVISFLRLFFFSAFALCFI
jgi:hypothetical protein